MIPAALSIEYHNEVIFLNYNYITDNTTKQIFIWYNSKLGSKPCFISILNVICGTNQPPAIISSIPRVKSSPSTKEWMCKIAWTRYFTLFWIWMILSSVLRPTKITFFLCTILSRGIKYILLVYVNIYQNLHWFSRFRNNSLSSFNFYFSQSLTCLLSEV